MKNAARSLVSFTRTERIGILVLSAAIVVLLGVRLTMRYWVQPAGNSALEQKLRRQWAALPKQPAPDKPKKNKNETELPDSVNINTAELEILLKFPGIGEKNAQQIIDRRNKNGPYHSFDELKRAMSIKQLHFEELKKHIYFGPATK